MKIPFEFGVKLIFRLLFPGVFLTLGFMPLLLLVVDYGGWRANLEYVLGFAVVFLGWLVTLSDMPIYMIFEGRRYWPAPLWRFFRRRERRRLSRYRKVVRAYETGVLARMRREADRLAAEMGEGERARETGVRFERLDRLRKAVALRDERRDEAYFDLRNFPLSGDEEYEARYPTRLGNLMTAYEEYSTWAYGLDSVFYWYRIWLTIDKDTRDEIDNYQALADSSVYASFALYCSGLLWVVYASVATVQLLIDSRLPAVKAALPVARATLVQKLPDNLSLTWLLAAGFLLAGFGVYRISIRLHAQYGELFKAIFDVYGAKLGFEGISGRLTRVFEGKASGAGPGEQFERTDMAKAVARYLQYNRIRCPHRKRGAPEEFCNRLLKPSEVRAHLEKEHPLTDADANAPRR